jgi:hypothetical protein
MSALSRHQITAINSAYTNAIQLVRSQNLPSNTKDINTTINVTELGVRRIIYFFKLISDFRDLSQDLMLKLLKQNMMSLLQIHGVNSFNRAENTFKQPDTDDIPFTAESLKATYGEEIYTISMGITNNLYDLCNKNMTFVKIVMLVVLFDSQNSALTEKERLLVEQLQNKYVTLLYSCMCEQYNGFDSAEVAFKGLIFELNKINDLSKIFGKAIVEKSNLEEVRPLMQEVFSLSSSNHITPPQTASSMHSSEYAASSMAGPSSYSNMPYSNNSSVQSYQSSSNESMMTIGSVKMSEKL